MPSNESVRNPNLDKLIAAAQSLGPLLDEIVFVGGCVTGLLISDPAAAPVRQTLDVDAIVTVIDGRPELGDEVRLAGSDLRKYLSDEFKVLLSNRSFLDALPGHLLPDAASQQRKDLVLKRMQQLVEK